MAALDLGQVGTAKTFKVQLCDHIILIVAASLTEAPQLFTDVMHRNIKSQKKEKEVPLQQFYPLREMFHSGTKTIVVFLVVGCG
ncbi:hypothetical protein CGLAMM_10415 [Acetobacteraceae bacterium EV16G]|uniref:Uncharacterized protein n=1 Tax=Sorlinia euscelidii TaxID=3081148 RepID=A0ABU7U1V0_9PROT